MGLSIALTKHFVGQNGCIDKALCGSFCVCIKKNVVSVVAQLTATEMGFIDA